MSDKRYTSAPALFTRVYLYLIFFKYYINILRYTLYLQLPGH